jgi:hypothetical protein
MMQRSLHIKNMCNLVTYHNIYAIWPTATLQRLPSKVNAAPAVKSECSACRQT